MTVENALFVFQHSWQAMALKYTWFDFSYGWEYVHTGEKEKDHRNRYTNSLKQKKKRKEQIDSTALSSLRTATEPAALTPGSPIGRLSGREVREQWIVG